MIEINFDSTTRTPIFRQIAEHIKGLVASDQLQPGERLPTVRHLAGSLGISPGTAAKAYGELEREGVIQSRRGGGTVVSPRAGGERGSSIRQIQLFNTIGGGIMQALSLGFRTEEIEAAFSVHLARWREERETRQPEERWRLRKPSRNTIVVAASHDLALELLVSQVKKSVQVDIDVTYAGSLGGLIALQESRADLAGIHLLDEESGEYNHPYVRHVLPGRETAIVHLAYRIQGLLVAKGNPQKIRCLADLKRTGVTFINRQNGSGTRVLLDFKLRQHGIEIQEVKGYENEVDTHLSVARAIARGDADVGLGIEAAARACDLDFMPLFKERYDLVIPVEQYRSKRLAPVLKAVGSPSFKRLVAGIGGYDASETGVVSLCS